MQFYIRMVAKNSVHASDVYFVYMSGQVRGFLGIYARYARGYKFLACSSIGRQKNGARERDMRVSRVRPVFSRHYFQAPATQATQANTFLQMGHAASFG